MGELLSEAPAGGSLWDHALCILRCFERSVVWWAAAAGERGVRWARAAGFSPDKAVCARAAAARDVKTLRQLCAWRTSVCLAALREEDEDALEWAMASGFPWNADAEVRSICCTCATQRVSYRTIG